MIKNLFWLIGAREILIIFHNKLQKQSFKNSFIKKVILRKKYMHS